MSQPITNMAAQVTAPPPQVQAAATTTTATTTGWTHTDLFAIRNSLLAQMANHNGVLTVPLAASMPRSDQAAAELSEALGDIFMVIIDPLAALIIVTPDLAGIEARRLAHIARPKNCFVIYRLDKHPLIKALNPDMCNNDISKVCAKGWHNEPQSVKDEYRRRAAEEKRQHAIRHPDYRYAPRKPSEKKKRMTKNKIAKLATSRRASPATTQAPQQQQLPTAPALLHDPVVDTLVSFAITGDVTMYDAHGISQTSAHTQTRPRVVEQKRQNELDGSDNMEDFFAFDAADGPISDEFTLNYDAWEATWGPSQQ